MSCSPLPQHEPDKELVNATCPVHLRGYYLKLDASFQNYTDYFKCIAAKGEDFPPCKQFKKAYNSLCPSALPALTSNHDIL